MRSLSRLAGALLVVLSLAACKTELYGGLNEREANEMVAVLQEAGIPASKTREGRDATITVHVEDSRFSEAMALLRSEGLPGRQYETMGEIFRKEGFVSSPTEERARMIYALSEELSRTVAEIDGVMTARIHVVLPESDMLGRDVKPSSASVFVRYREGEPVEQYTSQIKLLVANSIEGLVYDNITVVMVPSQGDSPAGDGASGPGYVNVAGLWVHPGSEMRLKTMLGGAGVILALLAGLAIWRLLPGRRAEPIYEDGL